MENNDVEQGFVQESDGHQEDLYSIFLFIALSHAFITTFVL